MPVRSLGSDTFSVKATTGFSGLGPYSKKEFFIQLPGDKDQFQKIGMVKTLKSPLEIWSIKKFFEIYNSSNLGNLSDLPRDPKAILLGIGQITLERLKELIDGYADFIFNAKPIKIKDSQTAPIDHLFTLLKPLVEEKEPTEQSADQSEYIPQDLSPTEINQKLMTLFGQLSKFIRKIDKDYLPSHQEQLMKIASRIDEAHLALKEDIQEFNIPIDDQSVDSINKSMRYLSNTIHNLWRFFEVDTNLSNEYHIHFGSMMEKCIKDLERIINLQENYDEDFELRDSLPEHYEDISSILVSIYQKLSTIENQLNQSKEELRFREIEPASSAVLDLSEGIQFLDEFDSLLLIARSARTSLWRAFYSFNTISSPSALTHTLKLSDESSIDLPLVPDFGQSINRIDLKQITAEKDRTYTNQDLINTQASFILVRDKAAQPIKVKPQLESEGSMAETDNSPSSFKLFEISIQPSLFDPAFISETETSEHFEEWAKKPLPSQRYVSISAIDSLIAEQDEAA
ncbi:MAG: hypothetical protein SFT81_04040 [Candidatus Caenarcaniphilales bacterium]|nr:hypothetical protein [Candidatus Caenarcaniphilales bacterium]